MPSDARHSICFDFYFLYFPLYSQLSFALHRHSILSANMHLQVTQRRKYLLSTAISSSCLHTATQNMDKYPYRDYFCFYLYAFVVVNNTLLTSSCIVHRRKFPTSHRYILINACLCYFISFCIFQIKTCIKISIGCVPTFTGIYSV